MRIQQGHSIKSGLCYFQVAAHCGLAGFASAQRAEVPERGRAGQVTWKPLHGQPFAQNSVATIAATPNRTCTGPTSASKAMSRTSADPTSS